MMGDRGACRDHGGWRYRGPRRAFDRGSVTAELALALPSVVVVLGLVIAGGVWMRADIGATQAAASAARIALTQGAEAAEAAAETMVDGQAYVSEAGGWITARVVIAGVGPMPDVEAVARVPGQS